MSILYRRETYVTGNKFIDYALERIQEAVLVALKTAIERSVIDGTTVKSLELDTTPVTVAHGLGRVPQGFIITDRDAAEVVYRTVWTDRTITLAAGGPVVANLIVY